VKKHADPLLRNVTACQPAADAMQTVRIVILAGPWAGDLVIGRKWGNGRQSNTSFLAD
jgi:hypothetical protein